MRTIHVVAAVICEKDRVLATQRGYGGWKDFWEFPGGKIEPGETHEEALKREIQEELDICISVGEKLTTLSYDYPEFRMHMECYLAAIEEGELVLKEHEAARWLRFDELDEVRWLPADQILIDRLKRHRMNLPIE